MENSNPSKPSKLDSPPPAERVVVSVAVDQDEEIVGHVVSEAVEAGTTVVVPATHVTVPELTLAGKLRVPPTEEPDVSAPNPSNW